MSAPVDEKTEGPAVLADLKLARAKVAEKLAALKVQLLDRRRRWEDEVAILTAGVKLAELDALIAEGERLLGDFEAHVISREAVASPILSEERSVRTVPHSSPKDETDDQE